MTPPPLPSESTDDTRLRRDLLAYRAEWRQQEHAAAASYAGARDDVQRWLRHRGR